MFCKCAKGTFHVCIHRAFHIVMHATLAFVEFHATEIAFRHVTGHDSTVIVQGMLQMIGIGH